jgi:hypothetical protein
MLNFSLIDKGHILLWPDLTVSSHVSTQTYALLDFKIKSLF